MLVALKQIEFGGFSTRMPYVDFSKPELFNETHPVTYTDEIIKTVLEKRFPNGFRIDSAIVLSRFRRLVNEDFYRDIELDDEELREAIKACGAIQDGKVFVKLNETEKKEENLYTSYNEEIVELSKRFMNYDYKNWDSVRKIVCRKSGINPGTSPYQRIGIIYKAYKAGGVIPETMTFGKFIEFLKVYENIYPAEFAASEEAVYGEVRKVADIKPVLETRYTNGIKIDSMIEINRFRRFYQEDTGKDITLDDNTLKEVILSCGSYHDGKVYLVREEIKEKVKGLIQDVFESGALAIYYAPFFEKYRDTLISGGIISSELLKILIKENYKKYFCRRNRVSVKSINKEKDLLKQEILRVKENNTLLEFTRLKEKLPFIPPNKIRYVLMEDSEFIRTGKGTYTYAGNIELTAQEIQNITDYIIKGCADKGWITLRDYNFKKILERNGELTMQAVIDYYSNHHMGKGYVQHGKIITKGKKIRNQYSIIEEYVKSLDVCSLQEIFDFGKEITGIRHNINCIRAAYKVLVRTGKNRFVSDKYITFDVKITDTAISAFVQNDYVPIKAVSTFAAFPFCGEAWNSYLLESFCLRFSKKYHLEFQTENSKNAGAIVKKESALSYEDIMADALGKSKTPLEEKAIVNFLRTNGYIASKTFKRIDGLITKAKAIRGGSL